MYLNYANIAVDADGRPVRPTLRVQTLSGLALGSVPFVSNLQFVINYAEPSEISFDTPYMANGVKNPVYGEMDSYRVLYTEHYGVYIITSPEKEGDGTSEILHVHGYSLEKLLERRDFYLEEGTYSFWNPVDRSNTVLGRILEVTPDWTVGEVDAKFIGMYRTFDEQSIGVLDFCRNTAAEKYGCVFVFDVYKKTINVYDDTADPKMLPIYLSYENLVESTNVEEITDDVITKLHVYGADNLNIRSVNPTGGDYLTDLSYFIAKGDLDIVPEGGTQTLAQRVSDWQKEILNRQSYFTGLVAAKASANAKKTAATAALTELQGELDNLKAQQSVTIQAIAMESTATGKRSQQTLLDGINAKIAAKQAKIAAKKQELSGSLQDELDGYTAQMEAVTRSLNMEKAYPDGYFTQAELDILYRYMLESTLEEETFVSSEIGTDVAGTSETVSGTVTVSGGQVEETTVGGKTMYILRGGSVTLPGTGVSADVIRGTAELSSGNCVLSCYLGTISYGSSSFASGTVVVSGTFSGLSSDVAEKMQDGVTEKTGTFLRFSVSSASLFFTVSASEYQTYCVQKELYDFGAGALNSAAWPVYEFSVNSANFLFLSEFLQFRNELELGCGIYLKLGSEGMIHPKLLGLTLNFESPDSVELTFSNRYQRKNGVESLADMLAGAYSSGRKFDASRYLYSQMNRKTNEVADFLSGSLDAAARGITAATNQSVTIDGAGLEVGDGGDERIRLINNMIAMTDDNWQTAKVAIGRFAMEDGSSYWGVNADVIGGKLLVGNNLVIESTGADGNVQFRVDADGATLTNAKLDLEKEFAKDGTTYLGRISLYPLTGFLAGAAPISKDIYATDSNGKILGVRTGSSYVTRIAELGSNVPLANFWIDMYGDVYLKGRVIATDGVFSGTVYAKDGEFSGSVNATAMYINGKDVLTTASDGTRKIKDNFVDLSAYYTAERVNGAITSQAALTLQAAKDSTTTALTSYYTKEDADSVISSSASATLTSAKNYTTTQLGNYYTKSATNSRISSQATATLTSARNYTNTTLTSYYTSKEADKKIAAQAELTLNAAKDSTTTALTSYYTKEEADSVITSKGYVTMEATANYVKTELGSYYTKSDINRDYYTRAEVKTYCDENCATAEMVAKVVDSNGNVNAAEIVASVNKAGSDVTINANHIDLSAYYTSDEIDENYYTKAGVESYCGKNFATTTLIAEVVDPDTGEVNAGGIVVAINNGDRDIVIDADRINLNGVTTMSGLTKVSDKLTLGDGATSILYMESGTSGSYIKGANNCIEIEANKVILPDPSYVYVGSSTLYSYLQESGGGTAVFG